MNRATIQVGSKKFVSKARPGDAVKYKDEENDKIEEVGELIIEENRVLVRTINEYLLDQNEIMDVYIKTP